MLRDVDPGVQAHARQELDRDPASRPDAPPAPSAVSPEGRGAGETMPAQARTPEREGKSERSRRQDRDGGDAQRDADGQADPRGFLRRHPLIALAGLVALVAAALGGYLYWDYARRFESTDDAFIDARQFGIAPKVSGYVVAVPVTDNQHVEAGDVIARLDDCDYRIALAQAQAQVAAAEASVQNVEAQLAAQQAQVAEA
jgi:membrane fusion protein (multidrug efflux system)